MKAASVLKVRVLPLVTDSTTPSLLVGMVTTLPTILESRVPVVVMVTLELSLVTSNMSEKGDTKVDLCGSRFTLNHLLASIAPIQLVAAELILLAQVRECTIRNSSAIYNQFLPVSTALNENVTN